MAKKNDSSGNRFTPQRGVFPFIYSSIIIINPVSCYKSFLLLIN